MLSCELILFVPEWKDLIIESIYADVILGKLDQKNQLLEIDYAIGRDIRPEQVSEIINVLQDWWVTGLQHLLARLYITRE